MLRTNYSETHSTTGSVAPSESQNIAPRDYQPARFSTKLDNRAMPSVPPAAMSYNPGGASGGSNQPSNSIGGWSMGLPYSLPIATRISRISPSTQMENGTHSSSVDEDSPPRPPGMSEDFLNLENGSLILASKTSGPYHQSHQAYSSSGSRRGITTNSNNNHATNNHPKSPTSANTCTPSSRAAPRDPVSTQSLTAVNTSTKMVSSKVVPHSATPLQSPLAGGAVLCCSSSAVPSRDQVCLRVLLLVLMLVLSVASPGLMLLFPHLTFFRWPSQALFCSPQCESALLAMLLKACLLLPCFLVLLVYWQDPSHASSRRLFVSPHTPLLGYGRCSMLGASLFLIFIFWLMYVIRVLIVAPISGTGGDHSGIGVVGTGSSAGGIPSLHSTESVSYDTVVSFVEQFVDLQLWCCLLSLSVLWFWSQRSTGLAAPAFVVEVVRSPDGAVAHYTFPAISIHEAGARLLEFYLVDFQTYNPLLESAIHRRASDPVSMGTSSIGAGHATSDQALSSANSLVGGLSMSHSFTSQETNATSTPAAATGDTTMMMLSSSSATGHQQHTRRPSSSSSNGRLNSSSTTGGRLSASEWFHEEEDYARRLSKQKARLVVAAEEAFLKVRRLKQQAKQSAHEEDAVNSDDPSVDPYGVAQSIFPSLVKPLQKYLRLTRQQGLYSMEHILEHLAQCLFHRSTSRTFVERYLVQGPVYKSLLLQERAMSKDRVETGSGGSELREWRILCGKSLVQQLQSGLVFHLAQPKTGVQLLCTVHHLPRLWVKKEPLAWRNNRLITFPSQKPGTSV